MGKRKIETKRGKRISTEEKKTKIKKNKEKYDKKKNIEAKRERKRLKKEEKARLKAEKEAAGVDSKKRKREDGSESQVAKKTSKTGFPDPIRDKHLPKQARKVLVYAFERYDRPDRWKFNKSRQNWLVRNVWNSQTITDTHMPLALKYISSLQGNARQNLLNKCTSILEAPQPVEPTTEEPTTEEAASISANKNKIRTERARAIFDTISAANPVEVVKKKDKSMDDEEGSDSDASDSGSASSKSSSSESSSE